MVDRSRRFALIIVVSPFLLLAMVGSARATFITVNTLDGAAILLRCARLGMR